MAWRTFRYSAVISESGLDSFGHLNNAVYLRYFEDARWSLMNEGGYSRAKIEQTQEGPVILEIQIRFKKELVGSERIHIDTRVSSYEGKIARLNQQLKLEDESVAAEAQFTVSIYDIKKRKLILPSEEWLRVLGKL